MATEVIVVVGKSPLDGKYGFNITTEMTYGSVIPAKIADTQVADLEIDESAGSVILNFAGSTNVLGTNAAITLANGATIDLAGVAGVYTAVTPSTTFTDIVIAKEGGVQNMVIGSMSGFASATTSDANTIVVTLDQAADKVILANWTVDIDAGTDNTVTAVTVTGTTVTLTVTDAITVGQVVTVSHTRTTDVDTVTAGAVTNLEA